MIYNDYSMQHHFGGKIVLNLRSSVCYCIFWMLFPVISNFFEVCKPLPRVNICNSTRNNLLKKFELLIFGTSPLFNPISYTPYFTWSIGFNVILWGFCMRQTNPTSIYLFQVNNENARTLCKICSKLTIQNDVIDIFSHVVETWIAAVK